MTYTKEKRELRDVLIVMNSTTPNGWLPLGNELLMQKIKQFNITFNPLKKKWEA